MLRTILFDFMKHALRLILGLAVALRATAAAADAPSIDQRVDSAVDRGVEYILKRIELEGWVPAGRYPQGYTALQVYALLKSDVSHRHPIVQAGLRSITETRPEKVYSVSLAVMALGAALEQIELEATAGSSAEFFPGSSKNLTAAFLEKKLKEAVAWLIKARVPKEGSWSYELPRPRRDSNELKYDHSNTQFAILALGIAEKHGISVPKKVWEEIADHFSRFQERTGPEVETRPTFATPSEPRVKSVRKTRKKQSRTVRVAPLADIFDGGGAARGWTYIVGGDDPPTFSMTSAGLSSAILAHRRLSRGSRVSRVRALETSIRDGVAWVTRHLTENPRPRFDAYALYSLEKVGDLGLIETFGDVNWYEHGAETILAAQSEHGGWGQSGSEYSRHTTALCLLFLGRATALEPRSSVRITGVRGSESFSTRYVVHIPSLDRSFPVIELFRRLRYSPTAELAAALDEIVEVYDADYSNELVRFLLTLRRSPARRISERADVLLERVTGIESPELGPYLEWDATWAEVVRIALQRSGGYSDWLRERLAPGAGPTIRRKAIWAVQILGDEKAIGELIDCLGDHDRGLREAAYDALVVISGQRLAFDPKAPTEERTAAIAKWREWWSGRSGKDGAAERPKE